jgi:hypothetical protein
MRFDAVCDVRSFRSNCFGLFEVEALQRSTYRAGISIAAVRSSVDQGVLVAATAASRQSNSTKNGHSYRQECVSQTPTFRCVVPPAGAARPPTRRQRPAIARTGSDRAHPRVPHPPVPPPAAPRHLPSPSLRRRRRRRSSTVDDDDGGTGSRLRKTTSTEPIMPRDKPCWFEPRALRGITSSENAGPIHFHAIHDVPYFMKVSVCRLRALASFDQGVLVAAAAAPSRQSNSTKNGYSYRQGCVSQTPKLR